MDINFNVLALIPFFLFLYLFIKLRKKNKNNPGVLLIGIYLLGSIFSIFVDLDIALPLHNTLDDNTIYFLIYSILIAIFLIPVFKIRRIESVNELRFFKKNSLILNILSISAWFSILYLIPHAFIAMSSNLTDFRVEMNAGEINALPKNIKTTLAVGVSSFYPIFIFLFYMSIAQKRHLFTTISMFVGGLSYVVSVLAFAGRDGFIFFILLILIFYKYFERVFDEKYILKYKKPFYVIVLLSLAVLFNISNQRFEREGGLYSTVHLGILGYGGMQPYIFNDYMHRFDNFNYGNNHFHYIKKSLNIEVKEPNIAVDSIEWQFGTFLTAFYKVSGIESMLLISLIFLIIFYSLIPKINNAILPFRMIILPFYFQFMVTGLFYFRLGNPAGNKYMIILTLLFIFLLIRYKGIPKIKAR